MENNTDPKITNNQTAYTQEVFKLAEIVPEEYDYHVNHFYQEYLDF